MVDIHCHILPGIDDGSKSWEMSADMCSVAVQDGITHVVATPHANYEYTYDRDRYVTMLAELQKIAGAKLTFSLGCDFHFSYDNIQDALAHPRRYTIADSRYLLVEFSDFGIPPGTRESLSSLSTQGMVPIITHPERNQILSSRPEMVMELIEQGCLVQVTADAFTGHWGSRAKKTAEWLLRHHAVHVVASDAHDPEYRKPGLSEARNTIARTTGLEIANTLVRSNPAAIVADRNLPYQPL
jgi:protein-tyrosine phosphatase